MNAWQITLKDLRLLVRDRQTLFVLVALPMIFISILGLSTGQFLNMQDKNQRILIAIANEAPGDLAAQLVEHLRTKDGVDAEISTDRDEAIRRLDTGKCMAAIVIGPSFQKRVDALTVADVLYLDEGRLANGLSSLDMHVISRASFVNTGGIVRQLVFDAAVQAVAPFVTRKNKLAAQVIDRGRRRLAEQRSAEPGKSQPVPQAAAPPETSGNVYQILVPSYTVMFAFFLVNIMARSFIGERDIGTLCRLKMSRVTPAGLLLGKTAPFFIISLVQSGLLFAFGRVLFGMSWGNTPAALILVVVCTSLAATALGLLVATVVRSDSQVAAYANFLVITMAALSGCFIPRDWQPEVLRQIGLITPHAWALIAYDELLVRAHANYAVVGRCCLMVLTFAAAFFTLGWWRFRKFG